MHELYQQWHSLTKLQKNPALCSADTGCSQRSCEMRLALGLLLPLYRWGKLSMRGRQGMRSRPQPLPPFPTPGVRRRTIIRHSSVSYGVIMRKPCFILLLTVFYLSDSLSKSLLPIYAPTQPLERVAKTIWACGYFLLCSSKDKVTTAQRFVQRKEGKALAKGPR